MAIKFFNVKTKETRTVDTEPMVSAFYNSSDLGPNARVGQDMGWRLAPEVVVRIKKMKTDEALMTKIAANYQIPRENLTDTDLLFHISQEEARAANQRADEEDHTDEYNAEIDRLSKEEKIDEKKIGETASEETERVSQDDRSAIEKASGSVAKSDDDSVNLSQGTIKQHDKDNADRKAEGVTSNEHEEGSIADGTAKHEAEDDQTLDEIIEGGREEGEDNAEDDLDAQVPAGDEEEDDVNTSTGKPEAEDTGPTPADAAEEGRATAEENTGADLPEAEGEDDGEEDDDKELSEAYSRSRKELNKLAADRGVADPESYPNKDALAEAIKNA